MLSDPVAEAFGLIHRHPSGENFWRVNQRFPFHWQSSDLRKVVGAYLIAELVCLWGLQEYYAETS